MSKLLKLIMLINFSNLLKLITLVIGSVAQKKKKKVANKNKRLEQFLYIISIYNCVSRFLHGGKQILKSVILQDMEIICFKKM